MQSLASRAIKKSPFERLLVDIYPQEILGLSYEEYLRMDRGKLRDVLIPGTHLIPYGNREELAKSFIARINPRLAETRDILGLLDIILRVLLSENRLFRMGSRAFLWNVSKDKQFILFTSLGKEEYSTLEETLQEIFRNLGPVEVVTYHEFPEAHRNILETMVEENTETVKEITKFLQKTQNYYEIIYTARDFSFYPLNYIVSGYVVLTRHGLFILGDNAKGREMWAAYNPRDMHLVLAVEAMNLGHTSLQEEEN